VSYDAIHLKGSVLLMVVFVIALLATVVTGILAMNTEEIQLMQNHVYSAQAMAIAEAGLNDALTEIRQDPNWTAGFQNKPFAGGSYTVTVPGTTVVSVGTTEQDYVARIVAEIDEDGRIESFRINE
jgi:hypothetical protein